MESTRRQKIANQTYLGTSGPEELAWNLNQIVSDHTGSCVSKEYV